VTRPGYGQIFVLALAAGACSSAPAADPAIGPATALPATAATTAPAAPAAIATTAVPPSGPAPPAAGAAPAHRMISGLDGAAQVGVGSAHACALRRTGDVVCWGSNDLGQLGAGGFGPAAGPITVSGLADAVSLSVYRDHACAARSSGQVACWGGGVPVPAGNAEKVSPPAPMAGIAGAVSAVTGSVHTCALLRGGQVACVGENSFGALGDPAKTGDKGPVTVRGLDRATAIALSHFGGCAARGDGAVLCWGSGAITAWAPGGPPLRPAEADRLVTPALVPGVTDAIAVGTWDLQACLLRRNGSVRCWNTESRSMTPRPPLFEADGAIGAEDARSIQDDLVVLNGGRLACSSADPSSAAAQAKPVLPELTGVIAAAGTEDRGCAALSTGHVACWGGAEEGG
jgi:hypothetical protein